MRKIAVADIAEGLVLAEDVADAGGRVILPAGEVLAAVHVEVLQGLGVATVAVVDPLPGGLAPDAEEAGLRRRRLEHMFEGTGDDLLIKCPQVL